MTDAELLQTLKLINGQRLTIALIARIAGVSREGVYLGIRTGRLTEDMRSKLIQALATVEKRGYHIPRVTV